MLVNGVDYYSVGPDDLGGYYEGFPSSDSRFLSGDFFQVGFKWIVCWYRDNGYDGEGTAVALDKNGRLFIRPLDHCSCFGPLDSDWKEKSLPSFFNVSKNALDEEVRPEIKNKMKELLGLVEVVALIDLEDGDFVKDSQEQFFVIVGRCDEKCYLALKANSEPYWVPHANSWAVPTPKCLVEVAW